LKYKDDEQQRQAANGDIPDFRNLQAIIFQLPPTPATELKLWLHQLTPEDFSERLPGRVTVQQGEENRELDLIPANGQVLLPLNGAACRIEIKFGSKSVSSFLVDL
jgi:hypothetical protein